jgi:hypothetical protein
LACVRQVGAYAFPGDLPFELGEDREQARHVARSAGVVRSSASVSETNQLRDVPVPGGSLVDPRRTGPSDPTALPADCRFCTDVQPPAASRTSHAEKHPSRFFDPQSDPQAAPGCVFPHRARLEGNGLLVVGRNAGVKAYPKTESWPDSRSACGRTSLCLTGCPARRIRHEGLDSLQERPRSVIPVVTGG